MTYIDAARNALTAQLPGQDPYLLDLYLLLALVKGPAVTRADVHEAWAIRRSRTDPNHPHLVPFADLPPEVQDLDQAFADAIATVGSKEAIA